MIIKAALCDDDLSVLNELNLLIGQYVAERGQQIVCTAFNSPLELLNATAQGNCFDVLFLDIIMPDENGINIAKEIRRYDSTVKIVFLTSSSEFAVQSYAVDAYFYQIKPFFKEGFFSLMDAIADELKKAQQRNMILRTKGGITRIDLEKLEYCEVFKRTLLFHMEDGKLIESAGKLDDLYEQLAPYKNFLRPHRSFLVNMEYIQNISHNSIKMYNLAEIPIPHGKCSEIKQLYLEYAFNRKQAFIP